MDRLINYLGLGLLLVLIPVQATFGIVITERQMPAEGIDLQGLPRSKTAVSITPQIPANTHPRAILVSLNQQLAESTVLAARYPKFSTYIPIPADPATNDTEPLLDMQIGYNGISATAASQPRQGTEQQWFDLSNFFIAEFMGPDLFLDKVSYNDLRSGPLFNFRQRAAQRKAHSTTQSPQVIGYAAQNDSTIRIRITLLAGLTLLALGVAGFLGTSPKRRTSPRMKARSRNDRLQAGPELIVPQSAGLGYR